MTKKYGKNKNQRERSENYIIPVMAILLFVPMIVRMAVVPLDDATSVLMNGMERNYDFFSYYKANFFIGFSLIAVVLCVFYKWKTNEKYNRTIAYLPLLAYVLAIILSAYQSQYREPAFFGTIDRYEGMYTLLGYLLVCTVSINMVKSEKSVRCLMVSLSISTAVICLIGLFQLLGYDLFKSDFGQQLIIPAKYRNLIENVNFILAALMPPCRTRTMSAASWL